MRASWFFLTVGLLCLTHPLRAATPMEYFNSLVAGHDDGGYQDGAFDDAYFNRPQGLAFDTEGNRLFVADEDNHRIRVVYPYENGRVETLAGSGVEGNQDGSLTTAQFKQPTALAYLPGDQLAVFDIGDGSVRLIDIPDKQVTTLVPSGIVDGYNMVYWSKDKHLYISDQALGRILRLDLKTKALTTILDKDPRMTQPRALCVYHDEIYVSDGSTQLVCALDIQLDDKDQVKSVDLRQITQKAEVVAMTVSDDQLYGIQAGDNSSLVKLLPELKPVSLPTAWGFFMKNDSAAYAPFLNIDPNRSLGFTSSPKEPRKFFITERVPNTNSIISVKDYDFKDTWGARSRADSKKRLSDFDYPAQKPPHTFRILIAGNSMLVTAPTAFDDKDAAVHDENSLLSQTLSKQLEFFLNAEGSLDDVGEHFEVLNVGHPSGSLMDYGNAEIPDLVKKYDVDLVIDFVTPYQEEQFHYYYEEPLTDQGIPTGDINTEFLMKPISERMPAGAPGDLFTRAKAKQWADINAKGQVEFKKTFQDLLLSHDPDVRADLLEMFGKPLRLLAGTLGGLKTSGGQTTKFMICFVPSEGARPLKEYQSFWNEIAAKDQIPMMDLSKNFDDLKTAFFPITEECCHHHFLAYGNTLIAYLMSRSLLEGKWVPFEGHPNSK